VKVFRKETDRPVAGRTPADPIGALLRRLPERLTGDPKELARRYGGARASGDSKALAESIRRRNASYYLLLLVALALAAAMTVQAYTTETGIGTVERSGLGGDVKYVDAVVGARYGDVGIDRQVSVAVLPAQPTPDEIADAIADLKARLPEMILNGNGSADCVTSDLYLPTEDGRTGAIINWQSDRPEIIDETGMVNLIEGKPGEEVALEADITLGEATDHVALSVVTGDPGAAYDYTRDLEESVDGVLASISEGEEGTAVTLPEETESGIGLVWERPRESGALALLFFLPFLGYLVYRNRYKGMDNAVARMRASIRRDFPDFLAKLLLLLNAGLVVTAAVSKIADDYRQHRRAGEEKVFFEELCGMESRIRGANTSLIAEFSDLAVRSGQREVMRFSAILGDNIDKGSALADKLMQEEGMLRMMRKKRAEERGRLAETKLTFPMALQLGAIILITVAPAAFEMQQ
jgi:hypothetical protein